MAEKLRVAVAGASGIGKHHAKWYHLAGCEVVGFLGHSADSCAATEHVLEELFGFEGKGYWELERLLTEEQPDIVDVCLPNELHCDCAMKALEAGAHILCEKPLVWHEGEAPELLLERGKALVDKAHRAGLHFGVCTQYAAALPHYLELYESEHGLLDRVASFSAEMETLSRGRQRDVTALWVDMGPHPLTLLQSLMPDGSLDIDSVRGEFVGSEARFVFDFADTQGVCHCEITVRDCAEGPPVRRFGVNDFLTDCSGRDDEEGIYRSVLQRGEREVVGEDFMAQLISRFVDAVRGVAPEPLVSGQTGLRNLELQLQLLQSVDR